MALCPAFVWCQAVPIEILPLVRPIRPICEQLLWLKLSHIGVWVRARQLPCL